MNFNSSISNTLLNFPTCVCVLAGINLKL